MNIHSDISELIGNTPMIELKKLEMAENINCKIIAKLEKTNIAGSIKDRVALAMINIAEKNGEINKDTVIIEPTSGNTGIGLCAVAASRGYKIIIVMPETMSEERKKIMRAYGAELVLTKGEDGMAGAIKKTNDLASEIPNSFVPSQFTNMSNPKSHFETTGPEIWNDTDGKIDILIAGVGTGGTITGTGEYLKSKNKNIKIVAVEPKSSPMISKGYSGIHKIQGIGAGFIPKVLNKNIFDDILTISDEEAFIYSDFLAKKEGILVGISSGAAIAAAVKIAKKHSKKLITAILPDSGERYLSAQTFD
ncbi:MAG: cysteine synthase A [Candidatus Fimenecus sp.]